MNADKQYQEELAERGLIDVDGDRAAWRLANSGYGQAATAGGPGSGYAPGEREAELRAEQARCEYREKEEAVAALPSLRRQPAGLAYLIAKDGGADHATAMAALRVAG